VYEEFSDDGLVVLALSDESAKLVAPYVDQYDLPFYVAAGSSGNRAFGIDGYPSTVLIAPDGTIAWQGHPSSLSKGTLKKALKGARRPKGGFLAVQLQTEAGAKLSKAEKLAADGELAAALKDIDATIADPKTTPEEQARATATKEALSKHVESLFTNAESLVKSREIARALTLLETLAKEFSGGELGTRAKTRREAITADTKLMVEVEAAKELDKIKAAIREIGLGKSRSKLEALGKKYPGTKAAERAKALLAS
jgi:hypothetical protein